MYNPAHFAKKEETVTRNGTVRTTHSGIIKKYGAGSNLPENRVKQPYGYSSQIAEVGNAIIDFQLIFSGNNLGFGFSKGDYHLRVLTGNVYITTENDKGFNETVLIGPNEVFTAKKGSKFSISTGKMDTEIIATYSKNFHKTLKLLQEPVIGSYETPLVEQKMAKPERTDVQLTLRQAREIRENKDRQPAIAKAAEEEAVAFNPNSVASMDFNLKPVFPTEDD